MDLIEKVYQHNENAENFEKEKEETLNDDEITEEEKQRKIK